MIIMVDLTKQGYELLEPAAKGRDYLGILWKAFRVLVTKVLVKMAK